ncbi:hypothetical protein F9B85_03650 [Heliorestis acidaminivorans]|uniref:Phage gp6-like head-tail connector protein n=1 Tax=Heliorestis acidaminivorans TaxID=553427 RepID=A0A6I0ESY7_9FIRM|nr:head-tail connector protein [Heliorestis acidaminivorans]KAB2953725.1 hypothetical protein F9B85_03650 [Heliorestis acidaminivorans]
MDVITLQEHQQAILTLDEVKIHLRVESDLEDAYIESLIASAIDFCENFTRRSLIERHVLFIDHHFPHGSIQLPLYPVQEIVKITYQDRNDVTKELPASDYNSALLLEPPLIAPRKPWPTDLSFLPGSLRIEAVVGYKKVPLSIKQAILLLCGHFYENREVMRDNYAHGSEIPFSVSALLYPYKVLRW